jgi:hypothetical protein
MKSLATGSALLVAATMLTACGGGNVSSSTSQHVESSQTISTQGLPARDSAAGTDNPGPHGPEINSGAVFTVTDGNVHMAYASSATITRTGDGVLVVSHGHARKFSAASVVTQSGSYNVYAPVTH